MKLYLLKNSDEPVTDFIVCSVKINSPWFYLCWSLGKPFDETIPEPIVYYADGIGDIEDFPLTNADQFLASNRLKEVILSSGAKFHSFESKIVLPNAEELNKFYTLNFIEAYFTLDKEKSKYEKDTDFPETKVREISQLVVNSNSIPTNTQIFRLGENESNIIVTDNLKQKIETLKLTGIKFIEVQVS